VSIGAANARTCFDAPDKRSERPEKFFRASKTPSTSAGIAFHTDFSIALLQIFFRPFRG
jgi:hypothetical protein